MALDFTSLDRELVREETDVRTAVSTVLKKYTDIVEANKNDPAALQAFVDRARQANDSILADIVAGTTADVPPGNPTGDPAGNPTGDPNDNPNVMNNPNASRRR